MGGQPGHAAPTEPRSWPACATSTPDSGSGRVTGTQEEGGGLKGEAGLSGSAAAEAAGEAAGDRCDVVGMLERTRGGNGHHCH